MNMNAPVTRRPAARILPLLMLALLSVVAVLTGCQTAPPVAVSDTVPYLDVRLREGDRIRTRSSTLLI